MRAQTVTVWGTGSPKREFIYVDDLAEACLIVLERYSGASPINVGTGRDVTIAHLAELVAEVVGFRGKLVFDTSRPDGAPRKLLDVSKIEAIGWRARTSLRVGLERAYADFITKGDSLTDEFDSGGVQSDLRNSCDIAASVAENENSGELRRGTLFLLVAPGNL